MALSYSRSSRVDCTTASITRIPAPSANRNTYCTASEAWSMTSRTCAIAASMSMTVTLG